MILYLLDLLFLLPFVSLLHRMFRLWGDLFPSAGRLSSYYLCSTSSHYIDIFSLELQFDSPLRVNSPWRGVSAFGCTNRKLYFCSYCLLVQQSTISAKDLRSMACASHIYIFRQLLSIVDRYLLGLRLQLSKQSYSPSPQPSQFHIIRQFHN